MVADCKSALGLSDLSRNSSVTDVQAIQSCQRLLKISLAGPTPSDMVESLSFEGHFLNLDTYYGVSADGKLKIPFDFNLFPDK